MERESKGVKEGERVRLGDKDKERKREFENSRQFYL
jgi:hypothetical protein